MQGTFELEDVDVGINLDQLQGAAEYNQAAKNPELIPKLENVIETWCKQIDQA